MYGRFEKFTYSLSILHKYLNAITREEMQRCGLKGPHAMYLLVLLRSEDGMTSVELTEACSRNKADVSRSLALFEKKGLIEREASASGTYRARIRLTEAGRCAAEGLRKRAEIAVELAGRGLSEQVRSSMYDALNILADNLRSIMNSGIPIAIDNE